MKPAHVADLIESDLRQMGEHENAERYVARFTTPEELLAATDLYGIVCWVTIPDEDYEFPIAPKIPQETAYLESEWKYPLLRNNM